MKEKILFGLIFVLSLSVYISFAVNYNFGTDAELVCEFNRSAYGYWKKKPLVDGGGYTQLKDTVGKYGNTHRKILTIYNLNFNDTGYYSCSYHDGKYYYGKAKLLTVTGIPDVSTTPTYYEVTGSTALLRCDPNPRTSPPIQGVWWSKKTGGSTPTFRTVPINETKFSGGDLQTPSLTISDLEATDNGIYRCNVNNAKGTGHSDSQLFIGDPPTVLIQNNILYPTIGQSINIPCTIGNSKSVQWKRVRSRRTKVIRVDSSKYSGGTTSNPSVTITNIMSSDDGEYQCCGVNPYGESCDKTTLISGKEPSLSISQSMLYIIRGHSAFLNVTVWSSSTITNSYWMRQIQIPNSGKYAIKNYDLTIHHVDQDDDGEYTFYAVNVYGTQSIKITLKTGRKPVLTTNQTLLYIRRGLAAVLDVTVSSTSLITGSYWEGQNRIYNSGRYTIDNYDLTVRNVKASDDGEYTFYAKNDYGTQSIKITLRTGNVPTVFISHTKYYLERLKSGVIDCSVFNAAGVSWIKNIETEPTPTIISTDSTKYSVGKRSNRYLMIHNVDVHDDGEYRCCGKNAYGTWCNKTTVQSGYKPALSRHNETAMAKISDSVIIGVTITSSTPALLYMRWSKDSQTISGSRYHGGTIGIPSLTINNVGATDDGTYTCYIYNGVGQASVDINLFTWNTPSVSLYGKQNLAVGSVVVLQCRVTSKPNVTHITWKKETVPINFSDKTKHQRFGSLQNQKLKIFDAQETDKGTYSCDAYNDYDTGTSTVEINVGGITKTTILNEFYVTKVGEDITLECLIKNDSTNEELSWLKDVSNVKLYNTRKYSHGTLKQPSLIINNVDKSDAGNYTCKLKNLFGTSEDVVELKVLTVYVNGPSNLSPTANESITLQCVTSGGNRVTWWKNGQEITTTGSVEYSGGTVNNPSLTISKVTRYHAGNYTCDTSYGSVTATSDTQLQLNVKDIPLVRPLSNNIQASTGDIIQLGCYYESYPEPTFVFWNRDGENLNVSASKYNGSTIKEPSLIILNTDQLDSGIYVCGVVNEIGTGYSSKIQLIIKDPEKLGDALTPIIGCVIGAIVLVALICIVIGRKRNSHQKDPKRKKVNTNRITAAEAVQFRIGTDEDEAPSSILMNPNPPKDDHISIKVHELKEYIFKKQMNNTLEDEFKRIKYGVLHPTTKAQQKENQLKNRFKEIFPYDHTRVMLEPGHGMSSDYINANYVDGFKKEKCYIASQGPLKSTINDHWRMIWQNNTRKIIMLTNLVEGTKRKCERYWPGGKPMTYGYLVLTLLTEKERAAYITREIEVEDQTTKEKRCITQYHFTAWPDHGTPDPLYLVLFHKHVISDHTSTENNGPILVHCSAGIGRTGTFIGLDALYEEGLATGFVDVVKFIEKMRYSRMNMVQTTGQYVCLHYALLEAFTMEDTNVGKKKFGTIWQKILEDKGPVNRRRLHEEFEMLKAKKSEQEKAEYVAAKSPENVEKNRNKSSIPSDKNRLFLISYKKGRTDYINAVQAPSYTKFVGYLTTQLPLPDTKVDFWTMVGDHNSSTIVVFLNDPAEADLVYSTSKDSFACGKYSLRLTSREQEDLDVTSCKVILSKKDDKARDIALYLAVTKGLPDPQVLCKLVNRISTRVSMSNDPVTVVSGDGAKICGVFCAFVNAVSSMTIDKNANIFQLARLLQLRRPEFFADFEEYRLCYEALNIYLVSSNVYENI